MVEANLGVEVNSKETKAYEKCTSKARLILRIFFFFFCLLVCKVGVTLAWG